jgi:hypothetical protein
MNFETKEEYEKHIADLVRPYQRCIEKLNDKMKYTNDALTQILLIINGPLLVDELSLQTKTE